MGHFPSEFGTGCSHIWLDDPIALSSPDAPLTWLEMEKRRGSGSGYKTARRQHSVSVRFNEWLQCLEALRNFGQTVQWVTKGLWEGGMGRGQCWDTAGTVSETLFVLNLILLVTLLGSPRSTKIFGCWSQYGETIFKCVLSYIMPPAQHTLLQASANEVSLISITWQGLAVWRFPNRALQTSGGCPWVPGRAVWLYHSWKAAARELTVGSS